MTDISREAVDIMSHGMVLNGRRDYAETILALRAALDRAEADKAAAVEATLDAAARYMLETYGIRALYNPVDRSRVAAIRNGGKP